METVDSYLENLNEDFSFVNKVFKAKLLSKISKEVKSSVKGNVVNMSKLNAALKPIPVLAQDKINNFLMKYVPNYDHNFQIAKKFFDKNHPDKLEKNEKVASMAALITVADNKKTIQGTTRDLNRSYSRGGTGGGAFIIFVLGLFGIIGAFSIDYLTPGMKALALVLGGLLILASIKSLS